MVQKCASSKKNLNIMVNVYKLSVSIAEEEKILYPSPPPPPFTIITTTTMMDLFRPSIEEKKKRKKKHTHTHKNIRPKTNENHKRKKISIKGSYIPRGVEGNATLSCVDKDCHF
jgi:hypothetical protein